MFDRPCGHARARPDQQAGTGTGIGAPQRDPRETPVHDHEHSGRRGSELDRQLRFTAAEAVHRRVDLRVGPGLGQRHHSHPWIARFLPARVLRASEPVPVRLCLRGVQHEPVHGGDAHPAVEGPLQARRGQRPGQLAEHRLQDLRTQAAAGPGERGFVRDVPAQLRDTTDHVLCHVVVGVLLEEC